MISRRKSLSLLLCLTLALIVTVLFEQQLTSSDSLFKSERHKPKLLRNGTASKERSEVDIWFFALTDNIGPHIMLAKHAVLSFLEHAASFQPVCLFHGKNQELETWLVEKGVIVFHCEDIPLVKQINANKLTDLGIGTWLRFFIPYAIESITKNSDSSDSDSSDTRHSRVLSKVSSKDEVNMNVYKGRSLNGRNIKHVLYTDVDILFTANIHNIMRQQELPIYFSFAVQGNHWCCSDNKLQRHTHLCAGVLIMNVPNFNQLFPKFMQYVLTEFSNPGFNDQKALKTFFPLKLNTISIIRNLPMIMTHPTYAGEQFMSPYYSRRLPKELEWEPYLGVNPKAGILHMHGYYAKFRHIQSCDDRDIALEKNDPDSTLWYFMHNKTKRDHKMKDRDTVKGSEIPESFDSAEGVAGMLHYSRLFNRYYTQLCNKTL